MQYGEDPELLAAIKASMAEEESKSMIVAQEPDKATDPQKVVTIQMRCHDGGRLLRRFLKETTTVQDLINYYKVEKKLGLANEVTIMTTFPKKTLTDMT